LTCIKVNIIHVFCFGLIGYPKPNKSQCRHPQHNPSTNLPSLFCCQRPKHEHRHQMLCLLVSRSGSRADTLGLGAARMEVVVARMRAEIEMAFIIPSTTPPQTCLLSFAVKDPNTNTDTKCSAYWYVLSCRSCFQAFQLTCIKVNIIHVFCFGLIGYPKPIDQHNPSTNLPSLFCCQRPKHEHRHQMLCLLVCSNPCLGL
jgi:hypothetical protein